MKRRIVVALLAVVMMAGTTATAQPATAQGGGCKAFGQNVANLATALGPVFGQTVSSNAPINEAVVEAEQDALCGDGV
jgi:hypothetical protein